MTLLDRRAIIAGGALAALLPATRLPAQDAPGKFVIDWQGGPHTPEIAASLAPQIAIVEALRIKPDIAAFFAAQVITIDLAENTKTRAGPRGVFFERKAIPPDNPVLLHELLHRYHLLRLPDGFRNEHILEYYRAARSQGYIPQAYMLTDVKEFFAMMASVTLYGHAARPPYTRNNVRAKSPAMYRWIVEEFGLVI